MSLHINAKANDIAKVVILPGDPARAKFIAEKFLKNCYQFNPIRNQYGYTGVFNNTKLTIFPSGMGIGSSSIYVEELYRDFNVKCIIRVGTCGALVKGLSINEHCVVTKINTKSNVSEFILNNKKIRSIDVPKHLLKLVSDVAQENNISVTPVVGETTPIFYTTKTFSGSDVVEMEAFSAALIAKKYNRDFFCLLIVSDIVFDSSKFIKPSKRAILQDNFIKLALLSGKRYIDLLPVNV